MRVVPHDTSGVRSRDPRAGPRDLVDRGDRGMPSRCHVERPSTPRLRCLPQRTTRWEALEPGSWGATARHLQQVARRPRPRGCTGRAVAVQSWGRRANWQSGWKRSSRMAEDLGRHRSFDCGHAPSPSSGPSRERDAPRDRVETNSRRRPSCNGRYFHALLPLRGVWTWLQTQHVMVARVGVSGGVRAMTPSPGWRHRSRPGSTLWRSA